MRAFAAAVATALAVAGCSRDSASATDRRPRPDTPAVAARKRFQLTATGYRQGPVANPGAVIGTVALPPLPPALDSTHACEAGSRTPAPSRAALVWISGVAAGKPYPIEKRFDLASEDCGLDPAILAAIVGSTVDVYNDDAALHRLVFVARDPDTLVTMPFFNTGQVVASERLAKHVGLVDVTCVRHPWTHATIAVFDQPYYAVTDGHGRFSMDSVPAGSYTLMVWRPDFAEPISRPFQVASGRTTKLTIGDTAADTSLDDQPDKPAAAKGTKRSATIAAKRRAR